LKHTKLRLASHDPTTASSLATSGCTASSPQDVSGAGVATATKNDLKKIAVPAYQSATTMSCSIPANTEGVVVPIRSSNRENCIMSAVGPQAPPWLPVHSQNCFSREILCHSCKQITCWKLLQLTPNIRRKLPRKHPKNALTAI